MVTDSVTDSVTDLAVTDSVVADLRVTVVCGKSCGPWIEFKKSSMLKAAPALKKARTNIKFFIVAAFG